MSNMKKIGLRVLAGLVTAMNRDEVYYVKDNFDEILIEEDDIFINDEDVIAYVKHTLSDSFRLEIIPVEREWICEDPDDNFMYGDIILKLIRNE